MNPVHLILARTYLAKTIQKLKNSLDEVTQKNIEPTERVAAVIKSMNESIDELTFSYVQFCEMEMECRTARQRANDLEYSKFGDMAALQLIIDQNKKLEAQNQELKEGL